MKIRPATMADLGAIQGLLIENSLVLEGVSYADFSGLVLVAEDDGEVIGFLQALLGKPVAVVTELAIARTHQGHGYGVKLIEALELLLRYHGLAAWACYTNRDDVMKQLDRYGAQSTGQGMMYVKRLA